MVIKVSADGKKPVFNEINITPLTDIFLVLLIIMMVIAPSFQSLDKNITIPEINSGVSIEEKNATVALTKEGELFLNGEKTSHDALEGKLAALISNMEKKEVVVKADEKAKSSDIMQIMRSAQNAGFEKLVVAGEPLSKKEQKELQNKGEEQWKDKHLTK